MLIMAETAADPLILEKGKSVSPFEGFQARRAALENLWRQGITGKALLREHTKLVDAYLCQCLADCPEAREGVALVAIGGYGRSELFPFSDIDLLLLYTPKVEKQLAAITKAVLYPLWDAGLDVGHGVRTPKACLVDAQKDFFFLVSLLDARLLAGSENIFTDLQTSFSKKFIDGRRQDFYQEITAHRDKRYQQYGKYSYLLEPHIKECRGGFRDIQSMLWTARVIFGLKGLSDLQEAGLLSDGERQGFEQAWDHLIRIRNQLHYLSGRKNDQLYFEHQEEMALAFEYQDEKGLLGVERFMRQVYGHMQTIAVTTDLFFEHVHEVLTQKTFFAKSNDRVLEKGIELRQDRIHLTDLDLISQKPYLLMRLFAQSAINGIPIHYRTHKQVSAHCHLIDEHWQSSRFMIKSFLEIFQVSTSPLPVLEAMLETGLLAAFIPEFNEVASLVQHDIYHVFTVDSHLLHTVDQMHQLREKEKNIFSLVANPSVLYLAALLHDVGKGYGHNHAERGAEMAEAIGRRLTLADAARHDLVFAVRHHLFLADTAMRRDLEDHTFIRRCAKKIETIERLAILYLLAIADAKATGSGVWNDWKAALLLELYLKIAHYLEQPEADVTLHQGAEWMRQQLIKQTEGTTTVDIMTLPADYLVNFSLEELQKHMNCRQTMKKDEVLVFPKKREAYWSLLIITNDRPGLLSRICGTLALRNLKVLAAQIFTWPDGTVVDELHVTSIVNEAYEERDWQVFNQDLSRAIDQRLGLAHRLSDKILPMGHSSRQTINRFAIKVELDNQSSDEYTIVEVYTDDRIGLLYAITKTLSDFGINIYRAKIGTRADQVVDVFYVLDRTGNKITDSVLQEEIRQALLHVAQVQRNNGTR